MSLPAIMNLSDKNSFSSNESSSTIKIHLFIIRRVITNNAWKTFLGLKNLLKPKLEYKSQIILCKKFSKAITMQILTQRTKTWAYIENSTTKLIFRRNSYAVLWKSKLRTKFVSRKFEKKKQS